MKHKNIQVIGKVQGVYFRASTKTAAEQIGVTGFVKNLEDGSVYIEAEGTEKQLEQLINWCHKGPDRAKVEAVRTADGPLQNFTTFEVVKKSIFGF
ncbi:acylphosphatase [Solitalea koreensis]|uniref:Acylphosphatase n=1 Tax=Solitalea koreensis TaxID=543615 RepID=A0A521CTF3_9SPHI|nr:acylphosphatase [Solitalea koreensis]SMO62011.1 acylphosphatase [Solitalea koreensis]